MTPSRTMALACCSFCLKPDTEVKKLVAGPGVYICDACIGLCSHLVESTTRRAPRVAPWEQETSLDEILAWLPRAAAAGAQVEANLLQRVRQARSYGATWARIGEALDMTRQSAWERFSGED
jgi:hypothetical protein